MSTIFLIDENLSPSLIIQLKKLGYNAVAVRDTGLRGAEDQVIVQWAQKNNAIIITCDKDLGELWYWYVGEKTGVIVLHPRFQSLKGQEKVIEYLHRTGLLKHPQLFKALIIASDHHHRLRISS